MGGQETGDAGGGGERREKREESDARERRPPGLAEDRQGARPARARGPEPNTEGSRDPMTSAVLTSVHAGRRVKKNAVGAGNHKAGRTEEKGGGADHEIKRKEKKTPKKKNHNAPPEGAQHRANRQRENG